MTEILDSNGTLITVGARVLDADGNEEGTVVRLTEPDADVNEYGRAVPRGPYVIVDYDDDITEWWIATWNATGPWDDHRTDYTCDDVTVDTLHVPPCSESVDLAAVERLERYAAGREPDGQRMEAGRIVPTDR